MEYIITLAVVISIQSKPIWTVAVVSSIIIATNVGAAMRFRQALVQVWQNKFKVYIFF